MPPANTPTALSPTDPAAPFTVPPSAPRQQRSITPLSYLSTPVPDLATTLHNVAADAADEANASFLRSSLEPPGHSSASAEQAVARSRLRTSVDPQRDPRRSDEQQATLAASTGERQRWTSVPGSAEAATTASAAADSLEDSSRRERLQRVLARLDRLHAPYGATATAASYSNRTPSPSRQSLYDWAPSHSDGTFASGRQQQQQQQQQRPHSTQSESSADLDRILAELRRQQPDMHSSILRVLSQTQLEGSRQRQRERDRERERERERDSSWSRETSAAGRDGSGEAAAAASAASATLGRSLAERLGDIQQRRGELERRYREHREHRDIRDSEWASLRSRAVLQRARQEGSPSATERILRYVMERERSGMSEEEERARGAGWFRLQPSRTDGGIGGEGGGSGSSNVTSHNNGSSSGSGGGGEHQSNPLSHPRDTWPLPPPTDGRRHLTEHTQFPRAYQSTTPPALHAGNMPGSASPSLENAFKYLDDLRVSFSYEDAVSAALDRGFATKEFFADKQDDFIMDLAELRPLPESSWLQAGTVFDGHQHALNGNHGLLQHGLASSVPSSHVLERFSQSYRRHSGLSAPFDHPPSSQRVAPVDVTRPWISHQFTAHMPQSHDLAHDHWPVRVIIHAIDPLKMILQGTMEAYDVPQHPTSISILSSTDRPKAGNKNEPIITYLEGHIIDMRTHSFLTPSAAESKHQGPHDTNAQNATPYTTLSTAIQFPAASAATDASIWRRLPPFNAFSSDDEAVRCLLSKTRVHELRDEYVFMRWKERCFVHSEDDQCAEADRHGDQDRGHGLTISGFYYISMRRSDGAVEGLYYDPTSTLYQHLKLSGRANGWPAFEFR